MNFQYLPEFFLSGFEYRSAAPHLPPADEVIVRKQRKGPPIIDLYDEFPGSLRSIADKLKLNSSENVAAATILSPVTPCPSLLLDSYEPPWNLNGSYYIYNQSMEESRYESVLLILMLIFWRRLFNTILFQTINILLPYQINTKSLFELCYSVILTI